MKQHLLLIFLCVAFFSCNTEAKKDEVKTDSAAPKEALIYPFIPKYSINWQQGDEKNAVIALTAFKKYLDGDVKGCFDSFADSIEFIADKFYYKGKKDSLMAMMVPMRASLSSASAVVDTWLTAYYPEKKDTWVTVWSTETWTDKKGKTDSAYLVDDIQMKDGKILQIDEKQRLFPETPKKK
ncbi:MAG TPA: hypothetical protein VK787_13980 [Puia sp.]|jgi:hypothetical protein|nr:hypothetical protein [Puia sp.]